MSKRVRKRLFDAGEEGEYVWHEFRESGVHHAVPRGDAGHRMTDCPCGPDPFRPCGPDPFRPCPSCDQDGECWQCDGSGVLELDEGDTWTTPRIVVHHRSEEP